jgi:hypothetical protein
MKQVSWWRNTIEDTEQNHSDKYQDLVLNALRDTLTSLIKENESKGSEIVLRYLNNNHNILRRLGLFLIGLFPNIFRSEVVRELLNSENLDDIDIHHEFEKKSNCL